MKKFGDLFARITPLELRGASRQIKGLTDDTRELEEGMVFVARRGLRVDGHHFIAEALAKGASGVVAEKPLVLPPEIAYARVADTNQALGHLAAAFFDYPAKTLDLIGITGTNGKTSVSWFLASFLEAKGLGAGLIGTILYRLGFSEIKARETTPPPIKLMSYLAEMRRASFRYAVLEVSSHALDQGRVEGLSFKVAAFTNLSRDHLDYHRHFEAYYQAKKKLFTKYLETQGQAVINVRDPWGQRLASELESPVTKVGEDLSGKIVARNPEGLVFGLCFQGEEVEIPTRLFGDFQLENLLVVAGCALALGFSLKEIKEGLEGLSAPPGRLELIARHRGAMVFVDYAHTPEALAQALKSLRPYVRQRLIVLFGCGGDRDQGKRSEMGRVAESLADLVILTSDNPRGEEPEAIIKDILNGMKTKPLMEVDRRRALHLALDLLKGGDVLLVAGKGHEDYQEISGRRYPFSDQAVIREILLTEAA